MGFLGRHLRRSFPSSLSVGVQTSVLNGDRPARMVAHDEEGFWLIGDGVNEPDPETNMVLAHMGHVLALNPRVAELADLPRSTEATWCQDGRHWHRQPLQYLGEDEEFQPFDRM